MSSASAFEMTFVPSTDVIVTPVDGDEDAVVDVVPPCLLQDQKSVVEFNTSGLQEKEELELVDGDSDMPFGTCSADVSEVNVEFVQTETARICTSTMEQSVPSREEEPISELEPVPETENAVETEVPYEFSVAECSHRREASVLEEVFTFLEETTCPEIQELTSENVEESLESNECLETAELLEKAVTMSVERLEENTEESVNDDITELPATEQVEGGEIPSEVDQAELKQQMASETGVENWSLEPDDVDDFFEMAYEGELFPEEIPSETVVLESKTQTVSSSSDQLLPDVFDGTTEDVLALEMEAAAPSEIPTDTVVIESIKLESSHTSGQLLTVVDEEAEVKEMSQEFEEITTSPDEVSSAFVVAEAAGLITANTCQRESPAEEEHPTEVLSEQETMTASCDEISSEFLEPSSIMVCLPHSVCDVVSEQNEEGEYADITAVDEEKVDEPEELSSSLVSTSAAPKAENLTTELVGTASFEDTVDDEPGPEAEVLPEGTTVDSQLVSDETVKAQQQSYSSQQTIVIEEDSLGDNVDELCGDSIEGEVVENLTAEAGSVNDLPQSCVVIVIEEHLSEELNDLPYDITPTSFVAEANEDANAESDSSECMLLPVTTVSSTEFTSISSVRKIEHRTPERELSIQQNDSCGEIEGTSVVAEPVLGDVVVELETAQTAPEPEVYEMYIEEEETFEEKIIESILTTVRREEVVELREEGATVEGTQCRHSVSMVWFIARWSS